MKSRSAHLLLLCGLSTLSTAQTPRRGQCQEEAFPDRPITIIVYTGPGGLIDTTARRFATVAAHHSDATFVIKNVPLGTGIAAMKRVLDSPADGYTLYAGTRSNVAKAITAGKVNYLSELDWFAMLMADPECIITRADGELREWTDLVDDARAHPGRQVWLVPDAGGLDHVMALKTWDAFGLSAKWSAYGSGGKAKAELLGGRGAAYVGNPRDAFGNDKLHIAVVSSPTRLPQFPDTPTFREFGIDTLDHETMWRGFAVRQGTPPHILSWYDQLFQQVTTDQRWRQYWEEAAIDTTYRGRETFSAIVEDDIRMFTHYLTQINLIQSERNHPAARWFNRYGIWCALVLLLAVNVGVLVAARRRRATASLGELLIPLNLLGLALVALAGSFALPITTGVGPAVVPRLWAILLIPLCGWLVFRSRGPWVTDAQPNATPATTGPEANGRRLILFSLTVCGYAGTVPWIGYYLASFIFLAVGMMLLEYRHPAKICVTSIGWLIFSYAVFSQFLNVPLPAGIVFESLFG